MDAWLKQGSNQEITKGDNKAVLVPNQPDSAPHYISNPSDRVLDIRDDQVAGISANHGINESNIKDAEDSNVRFGIDQDNVGFNESHLNDISTATRPCPMEDSNFKMNFNDNPQSYLPKQQSEEISKSPEEMA